MDSFGFRARVLTREALRLCDRAFLCRVGDVGRVLRPRLEASIMSECRRVDSWTTTGDVMKVGNSIAAYTLSEARIPIAEMVCFSSSVAVLLFLPN